jgi:catechol 2,3-dioxygenase-like lactoylglutathione lyase family enzyme
MTESSASPASAAASIKLAGVSHITIRVQDPERSKRFWSEVVGLQFMVSGSRAIDRDTEVRRCDITRPLNVHRGCARARKSRTDVLVGARGLGPP